MLGNCKVTFRLLNNCPPGHVSFSDPPFWVLSYDWSCVTRLAADRIKEPESKSWISDPYCLNLYQETMTRRTLLFVTGRWWCRSLAKVTKWVTIEKSNLYFVIPKTISVIPYPYNYLVSYPLSLKLFCQLSLISKTNNRASFLNANLRFGYRQFESIKPSKKSARMFLSFFWAKNLVLKPN